MVGATSAQVAIAATTGLVMPSMLATTSVASIVGLTSLASGSIANAKANKKEKQFKEERENSPIDKKTGFHKKSKKYTLEEDIERVNPGYKNWSDNTKNNCALCSSTLELRMRGYDVTAKKTVRGFTEADQREFYKNAKTKTIKGSLSDEELLNGKIYTTPKQQKEMIDSTLNEMKSNKNSRGLVGVTWNGTMAGHSMFYINENGNVKLIDAQTNEIYSNEFQIRNYFMKTSQLSITRTDNLELNLKRIKEVAE